MAKRMGQGASWRAGIATALFGLLLAGCSQPPSADAPPAPATEAPAPPPELLGGPPAPESGDAQGLMGGPAAGAADGLIRYRDAEGRLVTAMRPVPNPEDLAPAERRRIYGAAPAPHTPRAVPKAAAAPAPAVAAPGPASPEAASSAPGVAEPPARAEPASAPAAQAPKATAAPADGVDLAEALSIFKVPGLESITVFGVKAPSQIASAILLVIAAILLLAWISRGAGERREAEERRRRARNAFRAADGQPAIAHLGAAAPFVAAAGAAGYAATQSEPEPAPPPGPVFWNPPEPVAAPPPANDPTPAAEADPAYAPGAAFAPPGTTNPTAVQAAPDHSHPEHAGDAYGWSSLRPPAGEDADLTGPPDDPHDEMAAGPAEADPAERTPEPA